MGILTAIFLGIVQGVTEFLPVSSSGHLVLFETLFGFNAETSEMLLFDLATHVGTVVAVLIVFRKALLDFFGGSAAKGELVDALEPATRSLSLGTLVLMVVLANFCTGLLVLPFKKLFTDARGSLLFVALMWLVTGTLLWLTDRRKDSSRSLVEFGLKGAAIVGLAQAVAVLPGISRSGTTIAVAILLGLQRQKAVEFSMLIGIPAILGATLVEVVGHWRDAGFEGLALGPLLLGAVSATVVGVAALKGLIWASRSQKLKYFGFYCYALAVVVGIYQLAFVD